MPKQKSKKNTRFGSSGRELTCECLGEASDSAFDRLTVTVQIWLFLIHWILMVRFDFLHFCLENKGLFMPNQLKDCLRGSFFLTFTSFYQSFFSFCNNTYALCQKEPQKYVFEPGFAFENKIRLFCFQYFLFSIHFLISLLVVTLSLERSAFFSMLHKKK